MLLIPRFEDSVVDARALLRIGSVGGRSNEVRLPLSILRQQQRYVITT